MTSTFILAPGEEFVECPYNTAHQITNARLLTHLDKCRKAYIKELTVDGRQKYMKICRHNALHHFPAPEIRFHEERCPDAFSVVRHMAYHNSAEGNKKYEERRETDSKPGWRDVHSGHSSDSSRSKKHSHRSHNSDRSSSHSSSSKYTTDTKPINANAWGLEEENWESECAGYTPGYDPEVKLKSEVVIYNPAGMTKSERKKFRTEVREKAAEMSLKGEPVEFPTASTFDTKPNITDLKIKEEGNRSPPEPGEIEDDDDDVPDYGAHSGASGLQKQAEKHYSHRNSHDNDNRHPSSSSNSSSRHHYSTSKSSHRPSGNTWTSRVERTKEEFYPDSDDFEGYDPFI